MAEFVSRGRAIDLGGYDRLTLIDEMEKS